MMDMNVMMDCECDTGWNVEENGYECYDGLSIWVRLGLIYLIWIQMLRMDRLGLIVLSYLDNNVKDGYECYEFDIDWVWLFISSGYKC